MSGIGGAILNLMGQQDPRQKLIESMISGIAAAPASPPAVAGQPAGGAPYAAGQPGGPGTTGPAPAAAQPDGLKSPADLASMYGDLMKYQSRENSISTGIGLIASSLAQPENRSAVLSAATGGANGGPGENIDPSAIIDYAQNMQKMRMSQSIRASQLAALPGIAAKYGISPEEARVLFESGKLDEFINEQEKPNYTTTKDADGRVVTIDQKTGKVIGTNGPAETKFIGGPNGSQYSVNMGDPNNPTPLVPGDDRTNDQKNYEAYIKDENNRGTAPSKIMSFDNWLVNTKRAGANNTNIEMKAESAEAQKMGQYWGEQYTKTQDAGAAARDTLNNYDVIQKGLDTGINTGTLGESELAMRKFGAYLGLGSPEDLSKIAGGELVQKISNKMALLMRNPESGMGMPGSLSDKDLAFLKQSQIGISGTPAGNKVALEVFRRMEQRKIEMADAADEWVNGIDPNTGKPRGTMKGFSQYWRDWSKSHPMFDDIKVEDYAMTPEQKRDAVLKKYGIGSAK